MKKNVQKKVFVVLVMLLCSSVQIFSTIYNDTPITLNVGEQTNQSLEVSICKKDDNTTHFEATSITSSLKGVYQINIENYGNGVNPVYPALNTIQAENNVVSFDIVWETYPTASIQIYFVAYRDNVAGGSDIMGGTITDIDVSQECTGAKVASDLTLIAPAENILNVAKGDAYKIKYTTSSKGAVTYESSDASVATISDDGAISVLSSGKTTISVIQAADDVYRRGKQSFVLYGIADFSTTNLALNKPAIAGWGENVTFANNGDYTDRWGTTGGPKDYSKDWWYVDLGNEFNLDRIEIYWENAYSSNFVIQGAKTLPTNVENDESWQTLYAFEGEPKHTNVVGAAITDAKNEYSIAGAARYVRIKSYKNSMSNDYGMSIWEFRVFGTGFTDPNETTQMTSAKVLSVDQLKGTVTLELKATREDSEGNTSDVHSFRLINIDTHKQRYVTTDENGIVVLNNLTPCEDYRVDVIAVGYVESDDALHIEFEAPAGNMAYKRNATAGYSQGSYTPNLAVDGIVSNDSRWSGYNTSVVDAWWKVDLAEIRAIDSIRVNYESNEIDGFEIATSLDDQSWSPLVVSNVSPVVGWDVYKTSAIGRYMRIQPTGIRVQGWSIREFEVYGDCTYDDKPRMIFASLENVTKTTADVRVSATDAVTPFAELEYECILTQGENVYQFTMSATDGILHLENMPECSEHTFEVWAINKAGKKSDNSAKLRFTTQCDFVGLYLVGTMNQWMNKWQSWDNNYRFRKTNVDGIYSLTCRLPKGDNVYKLSTGSVSDCTKDDHNLVLSEDMDVTFYARSVSNFASSADSIFLIGTATSDFLAESGEYKPAWDCKANGKFCEWNAEHTSAFWTGNVYGVSGDTKGEYRIVKIAYLNGADANMPFVYWNDLWEANQTINGVSESATKASFVFDLPTLSWKWQEVYEGQCTFNGEAGDGQTHAGGSEFTVGYNISLYLNSTKDTIFVKSEFLDTDATATNALFQNYPQRNETLEVKEWQLMREGQTNVFSGKVPIDQLSNKSDGIIRFGIKFEFAGGLRVSTPEFYYLDGSGCAERDFVIYHHDQMPTDHEKDAVYTYAGGRILQPIQYKRKFHALETWETLSLPFEVNKITVSDEDGEYELYAQYDNNGTTIDGNFWLRDFREKEVSAQEFQDNWHDIKATSVKEALPKKNVPYIMRLPDDETHFFANKYIVFHGEGYQTIDGVYSTDVQVPRAMDMFAYSGNNTMKEWLLRSAYVLDDMGEYFCSDETVTLYPFECAVNAEQATIAKMPRLNLNKRPGTATDTKIPTTAMEAGSVWTLMGGYVGAFGNVDEYDVLLQRLPKGVYIVSRGEQAEKLYLVK